MAGAAHAAITGITVTGLVHWFLLRPLLHLQGADYVADKLLHLVVPVLAIIGWLVFGPRPRTSWPASLRASVWPIAWLVVMLVQGAANGWYPYPFLDHRGTAGTTWGRLRRDLRAVVRAVRRGAPLRPADEVAPVATPVTGS